MTINQRDLFEYWLIHMDDALETFKASLPPPLALCLDLSIDSLDPLEQHYLTEFSSTDDALRQVARTAVDGYARYVGEVLRTLLNTKWDLCLAGPKHAFYGLPTIKDHQLCPLALVTAAADRRTGRFWSTIANNQARTRA